MLTRLMTAAAVFALSVPPAAIAQSDPTSAVAGERIITAINMNAMRTLLAQTFQNIT